MWLQKVHFHFHSCSELVGTLDRSSISFFYSAHRWFPRKFVNTDFSDCQTVSSTLLRASSNSWSFKSSLIWWPSNIRNLSPRIDAFAPFPKLAIPLIPFFLTQIFCRCNLSHRHQLISPVLRSFHIHIKNCVEYLARGTVKIFIPLMRFLLQSLVNSCFHVRLTYSILFFFLSTPLCDCVRFQY